MTRVSTTGPLQRLLTYCFLLYKLMFVCQRGLFLKGNEAEKYTFLQAVSLSFKHKFKHLSTSLLRLKRRWGRVKWWRFGQVRCKVFTRTRQHQDTIRVKRKENNQTNAQKQNGGSTTIRDGRSEAGKKTHSRHTRRERKARSCQVMPGRKSGVLVVEGAYFHDTVSNSASQHVQEYLSNA